MERNDPYTWKWRLSPCENRERLCFTLNSYLEKGRKEREGRGEIGWEKGQDRMRENCARAYRVFWKVKVEQVDFWRWLVVLDSAREDKGEIYNKRGGQMAFCFLFARCNDTLFPSTLSPSHFHFLFSSLTSNYKREILQIWYLSRGRSWIKSNFEEYRIGP